MERGIPECYFGTIKAPSTWQTEQRGVAGWYLVDPIIAFWARRKPELAKPWPQKKGEWETDEILAAYSARLRPYVQEIIAAFADDLATEWWNEFGREFEERVRARKNRQFAK